MEAFGCPERVDRVLDWGYNSKVERIEPDGKCKEI